MTDDTGAEGAESPRLMRGAMIAIVLMGILILAGFAFIGVEVFRRATDPGYRARATEGGGAAAPAAQARDPLLLPAGTEIMATVAVGTRLAVTLRHPDGSQALLMVQPGDGVVEVLRTRPDR